MRVDMEEVEMVGFKGSDVVEPRGIGWVGEGGDSGLEGLEIESVEINDLCRGGDAGLEEPVSVVLDRGGGRKLRVRKRREGG